MGGEVAGVYARREAEAVQDAVVVVPDAQVVAVEVGVNTIGPETITSSNCIIYYGGVRMLHVTNVCTVSWLHMVGL